MKTTQELLDFYGVEFGKNYKVLEVRGNEMEKCKNKEFEIVEHDIFEEGIAVHFKDYISMGIHCLSNISYIEYKEILTDEEKEYLSAVIKPFRDRIKYIYKTETGNWFIGGETLYFEISNGYVWSLPEMHQGQIFKGMKQDKMYTLEELGL